MKEFIIAVVIIALLGLIVGLLLSVASFIFAVKKDERAEQIREHLAGANCGACGFSGCDAYAAALSEGKTDNVSLCTPAGADAAKAIGAILGVEAGEREREIAFVACNGTCENAAEKHEYSGVDSCRLAMQLFGGQKACRYGCLGFGDCVKACPFEAIFICDGVAHVSPELCRGCKMCVATCPKGIISMLPESTKTAVVCKSNEKGADTRKMCKSGCIGCGKCARSCPESAIEVVDNLAVINKEKCTGCGTCVEGCPVKCIKFVSLKK